MRYAILQLDAPGWDNPAHRPPSSSVSGRGDTSQNTNEKFQSSGQRCLTDSMKPKQLRISDKKDLLPSDICLVLQKLVSTAAAEYFLNNYVSIYEGGILSFLNGPIVRNNGAEDPFITAFDKVHSLLEGGKTLRLMLRIAYIQLVRVIDTQSGGVLVRLDYDILGRSNYGNWC